MNDEGPSPKVEAGRLIRRHRTAKKLSQKELAARLQPLFEEAARGRARSTNTQVTVSSWETGETAPSQWKVSIIEETLGMEPGSLWAALFGERPPDRGRTSPAGEDAGVAAFAGADRLTPSQREAIQRIVDEMLGKE